MILGMIDFKKSKKHYGLCVNWLNYKNLLYDAILESRHIVVRCKNCGQLLAPTVEHTGPRNCGWYKEGSKWVCHQCHYGFGGYDKPRDEVVKERNEKVLHKIQQYEFTHPWVKFKEV